jgi:ProP effector
MALLAYLQATYPVFREGRPLALGIHKQVLLRHPDMDREVLRQAMKRYTGATRYLKALATRIERYNLEGEVSGEVTAEQRDIASAALRERLRKQKERQVAEKRAATDAARAAEAQRQKQEKLEALVERFGRP